MKLVDATCLAEEGVSHDPDIKKKVVLRAADMQNTGFTQMATARIPPGGKITPHSHHDMIEVFYVLKGTGRFVVNDGVVNVAAGSTIKIDPKEIHSISNESSDADLEVLYFGVVSKP